MQRFNYHSYFKLQECINAYIEHLVCGCNVKLHIILYQPIVDNTEIETTLLKGIGRYGEDIDLQTYVTSLSSSSSIRTLHKFIHGSKFDRFFLILIPTKMFFRIFRKHRLF